MAKKTAISPTRQENYPEWYQQVVKHADMAETTSVRGCMVFKPWGFGLWENIQKHLNAIFKQTGHKNIYCPLLIPLSHLQREAKHVEGFSTECAVVTHHRLVKNEKGQLIPDGELEEPLIVRPTSETMMGELFSRWIQSYRDLPLLLNQWANVMRWEMRTRLFLRTSEFLWQEGHTAHATAEEAKAETLQMLQVYADFAKDYLAMPVVVGEKSIEERFPGAVATYCIEAIMQDGKALQAGTSHFLGQNFSKAFDISYLSEKGETEYAWTTSWGASTRLIGGLIMVHGDDDGLVLPPRVAPTHVVIIPAIHLGNEAEIMSYCNEIKASLQVISYHGQPLEVEIDARDERAGNKGWHWVKKGVPIRLEIGPRELESRAVFMGRRDLPHKERRAMPLDAFSQDVVTLLDDMQSNLLARANAFLESHTVRVSSKEDLYDFFNKNKDVPGFVEAFYHDDPSIEQQLKKDFNVTVRCFPLQSEVETGIGIFSQKPGAPLAVFAKAY